MVTGCHHPSIGGYSVDAAGAVVLIVMVSDLNAHCPSPLSTRTVMLKGPAQVGVPEIVPSAANERPCGKIPAESDQV
jgi:hypothetical protein